MSQRRGSSFLILALLTTVAGCSNDPNSDVGGPGTLRLRVTSPRGDDGAMIFRVRGPGIDTVVSGTELHLFTRRVDDSTLVGAMVGGISSGTVITLRVQSAFKPMAYNAQVLEVADQGNSVRETLEGYALAVEP